MERSILLAVIRRFPFGGGIHAEDGEVRIVAWPHPVVAVATKLCYVQRRVHHEAHIAESLHVDSVEAVSSVETNNLSCHTTQRLHFCFAFQFLC